MVWILMVVIFNSTGAIVQGEMLHMDDKADCNRYEVRWKEKYAPRPDLLVYTECHSIPVLKVERVD